MRAGVGAVVVVVCAAAMASSSSAVTTDDQYYAYKAAVSSVLKINQVVTGGRSRNRTTSPRASSLHRPGGLPPPSRSVNGRISPLLRPIWLRVITQCQSPTFGGRVGGSHKGNFGITLHFFWPLPKHPEYDLPDSGERNFVAKAMSKAKSTTSASARTAPFSELNSEARQTPGGAG